MIIAVQFAMHWWW